MVIIKHAHGRGDSLINFVFFIRVLFYSNWRAGSSVMMRVASRITPSSTREALDTNTSYRGSSVPQENLNYIFHNSLQRTLSDFRDHHKACAIRRRGAAAIEAQKESQRTEFLSKKYMETVRQEHNTTSVSIGLVSSHSSTQSSIPMSSNPAAATEEVKDLSIMLAPATEKVNAI